MKKVKANFLKKYLSFTLFILTLIGLIVFTISCSVNFDDMNNKSRIIDNNNFCRNVESKDEKVYWTHDAEMGFRYERISVVLKRECSLNNRILKLDDFGIDHEKVGLYQIIDRFSFENPEIASIDWENYSQILYVELKEEFRSRTGVINAIRELEKSPIVHAVETFRSNYVFIDHATELDYMFENEFYDTAYHGNSLYN